MSAPLFVEHDGRDAGPYTEQEIRDRLAIGTLRPTDVAWREGSSARAPLAVLFPAPLPGKARPRRALLWLAAVLLLIAYLVSPYVSLMRLGKAIESGDRERLESHVDFPAVRAALKEDLRAHMAASAAKDQASKDDPFAGLGAAFATALIDPILDSIVTPAGLATLIQQGKSAAASGKDAGEKKQDVDWDKVHYAFFTSPGKFLVDYDGLELRLRFTGLGWRAYRLELPPDALGGLK